MIARCASMLAGWGFRRAWALDTEFQPGPPLVPVCLCARDLLTGETLQLWRFGQPPIPCPFGPQDLIISHNATAEAAYFIAEGWPLPTCVFDTMVEMMRHRNGVVGEDETRMVGLLDANAYFGLSTRAKGDKDTARELVLRGPKTPKEIADTLEYCLKDADDAGALVLPIIEAANLFEPRRFAQVLWRGRYMSALAAVEAVGVPLDMRLVKRLLRHWQAVLRGIIGEYDRPYGVFVNDAWDMILFENYLALRGIAWPRTSKRGDLRVDQKTIRKMLDRHPELADLLELREIAGKTRLGVGDLSIGLDGRARSSLRPFVSITSRNQPSSLSFIFGQSVWLRFLIRAPKGRALIHADWSAQELGIAAVLSGDEELWRCYCAVECHGDPYIDFAVSIGRAEPEDTDDTNPIWRKACKEIMLGVLYGMMPKTLAGKAGVSVAVASHILAKHQARFPKFWAWSLYVANWACSGLPLETRLGWRLHWPPGARVKVNARSARNWHMQSHGAEMVRYLIIKLVAARISVIAPIHDAVMIECADADAERVAAELGKMMGDVSEAILGHGYRLRAKVKIIRDNERFIDVRGQKMFDTMMKYLRRAEADVRIRRRETPGQAEMALEGVEPGREP
jgi:DNA polymerase I-like protein with 3'-5' exonuclease and polymerase domains